MARSRVTRTLPPLEKACPKFREFQPGKSRTEQLLGELRNIIRDLHVAGWQPFYDMRTVAAYFGVSVPTVSQAYRQLAKERLLVVSRGSMTTVRPTGRKSPRARLTGVVAMPVWIPGFLFKRDVRTFHIALQRELQQHDMMGLPVFFEQEEELTPAFARQICRMKPDAVLWHVPAETERQTLLVIGDSGTHVITIQNEDGNMPGGSYQIIIIRALRRAFAAWRNGGVRRVIVPLGARNRYMDENCVETTAREAGLHVTFAEPVPGKSPEQEIERIESLASMDDTALVLLDRPYNWLLWFRMTSRMTALLARRRSLLLANFEAPFFQIDAHRADRITVDWLGIARRVAADIAGGTVPSPNTPLVFEAVWEPGVKL